MVGRADDLAVDVERLRPRRRRTVGPRARRVGHVGEEAGLVLRAHDAARPAVDEFGFSSDCSSVGSFALKASFSRYCTSTFTPGCSASKSFAACAHMAWVSGLVSTCSMRMVVCACAAAAPSPRARAAPQRRPRSARPNRCLDLIPHHRRFLPSPTSYFILYRELNSLDPPRIGQVAICRIEAALRGIWLDAPPPDDTEFARNRE